MYQFNATNGAGAGAGAVPPTAFLNISDKAFSLESDPSNIGICNGSHIPFGGFCPDIREAGDCVDILEDDNTPLGRQGASLATSFEEINDKPDVVKPYTPYTNEGSESGTLTKVREDVTHASRKRCRRSSSIICSTNLFPSPSSMSVKNLLSSTNNTFLTEGLLKIYHDSFENALSCWLIERTCPYSMQVAGDASLTSNAGADWNRIYHRVFRLDRSAPLVRGRQLTFSEEKAASKALNLAIFSFATQWAQASERSEAKYPFYDGSPDSEVWASGTENYSHVRHGAEFDRALQLSAWHEARNALQHAGDIESFRVVLAHIVFSLTQRPIETDKVQKNVYETNPDRPLVSPRSVSLGADGKDPNGYEDLLSKIDLEMNTDGPPIHLEQGLRLIHSLRSRIAMSGATTRARSGVSLDDMDRNTIDLLFWLGVMFDTLSSAMHKRPLVVSDEDSDIYSDGSRSPPNPYNKDAWMRTTNNSEGLWDGYLFASQGDRFHQTPVRWPCPFNDAASLLRDAAPVKVLLFRKITRIQTLLTRKFHGERVEKSIQAALQVYEYWEKLYAPFISDCIQSHEYLPPRIQSWYICLTGHWHLGALLLADLIEVVDDDYERGIQEHQQLRTSSSFVMQFREKNCRTLSDLARCACPPEDSSSSFSQSGEFHFAVNQGALLTEPWTVVLIRAFAKAGSLLLADYKDDSIDRADSCVQALWYLGRKSDMALSAAKILGNSLKEQRKCAQKKVNGMSSFMEAGLWQGFEELDDGNCVW
jgi:hypothetical protein